MANTKTIGVPHLFGTTVGYQMSEPYDPSKPTCVLINSFSTTSDLYRPQFQNTSLTDAMNLLAVEPLGHGKTRTQSPTFTYWDTAIMTLQVLDALSIPPTSKTFVLGTSQGGWIAVRMALLAPSRIHGIIPLGTSMDRESTRTRNLGCFDCPTLLTPTIQSLDSAASTPDFVIPDEVIALSTTTGFGPDSSDETKQFWSETMKSIYRGDEGRLLLKEIAVNLRDRDGLHGRLSQVRCPVLWMHGSSDAAYSVDNAREEIQLFVNSPDARVVEVLGGQHFLSATHPHVVDDAVREFVLKYS